MDKSSRMDMLYEICLDDKNINALVEIICDNIKLSDRSIPKCKMMIKDIMKKNIARLNRPPRNKEEFKELIKYLNKLCVGNIIEIITKKYPDLHIDKKRFVGKEQMKRDLDVWGNRPNHIQERPHIKSRKESIIEDDNFHSMEPNDIGLSGGSGDSSYADAFGNHLITNVPVGATQNLYNNPPGQKNSSELEQRYQQLMNERGYKSGPQKPETPDFTLDGSGEKVKQEKLMKKMQEQMNMNSMGDITGMGGMGGIGGIGGMGSMGNMAGIDNMGINLGTPINSMPGGSDDIYASILGAGAPAVNSNIPSMGAGNPLMPVSSTNLMNGMNNMNNMSNMNNMGMNSMNNMGMNGMNNMGMNGMGMNNMGMNGMGTNGMNGMGMNGMNNMSMMGMNNMVGQSEKSMQLQTDYEKKLAERAMIDLETNQPSNNNNSMNSNNMGMNGMNNMGINGMNSMGMNSMGMNNMGMNGMNNMGMNGMGMNNMGMNGMGMNGMGMNGMGMNGMGMGMGMNNMNFN
uniref:Uncharacterized protein n=1 Tax=Borely moumouvirus TaxID=2712067 RepID=A0A6G6ABH5_9VIRU